LRRTLGANASRLVRQWLTESLVLGLLGAAGGLLLARWVAPALEGQFPTGPVKAALNARVMGFTVAVTLAASIAFGLAPALHAGRTDPIGALRAGGRSTGGRRRGVGAAEPFVIAQIALSVILVVGAGVFARTLFNLEHEPLGFDRDNVLIVQVNPRAAGYTSTDVLSFYRRLYERVAALPGVEKATFARYSPFGGRTSSFGSTVEGYTSPTGGRVRLEAVEVGPDYPATLGMPVTEGRALSIQDVLGSPGVAMVNEAFAHRFYAGATALGHHVTLGDKRVEIVGVVKDALFHSARDTAVPFVFTAMLQEQSSMALDCEVQLRTSGDAHSLIPAIRKAVADTDSRVTVTRAQTMREQVLATMGPERQAAAFVGLFASLALALAAIGLYGVVAHTVAGRTNEIGVRVALGAKRADIVWLVGRDTLMWLALGLATGIAGASAGAHLVASQLFQASATDALSVVGAAVVLVVVAVTASLIPTLRALRILPAVALRIE
jgi:predicted permease